MYILMCYINWFGELMQQKLFFMYLYFFAAIFEISLLWDWDRQ